MKIAPIDIAHKSFSRKMLGFDQDEVIEFLRSIADELETVIREKNHYREQLREKELAIIEFKERDDLLKSTITTATKMADKIQQDAEREAKLIVNDANQKADMIIRDSRDSLKKIFSDISELKKLRMQFENNLRALIQSHLTMMEQGQKIMPNPELREPIADPESQTSDAEVRKNVADAVKRAHEQTLVEY